MNPDLIKYIKEGFVWSKLPSDVIKSIGISREEYNSALVDYCIKHQLRYKSCAIRHVISNERKYYEQLLQYSRQNLLMYPYHLQEKMVGLRVTPFSYYCSMMEDIMNSEKSYDSLPNFTAADSLRLLGIGRNQYIELMNKSRVNRRFNLAAFRKRINAKEHLPKTPVPINIEPWWIVHVGFITEDDIWRCTTEMKACVDRLIDNVSTVAGTVSCHLLQKLYSRGLIYLQVPIESDTKVAVPPLEKFVMNRVSGDYLETLLYKIFVSIDERTTVAELANMLDISLAMAKNAVGIFCRLGFAQLKSGSSSGSDISDLHQSWQDVLNERKNSNFDEGKGLLDFDPMESSGVEIGSIPGISMEKCMDTGSGNFDSLEVLSMDSVGMEEIGEACESEAVSVSSTSLSGSIQSSSACSAGKRIAFLFDSSLTAFLMMGNLSTGLKNLAVTLFEVGKLTDESLDDFLCELDKVKQLEGDEGDAGRYFDHAITLRSTIKFLRHNEQLSKLLDASDADGESGIGLDLIRCESLKGLDTATMGRLLDKKYCLAIAMAPLSDVQEIPSTDGFHYIGPSSPLVNSVWFNLYLYSLVGHGPPTLFLSRGTRLNRLPSILETYETVLVTSIGHEPGEMKLSNALLMLNEALLHSAVFVQGYKKTGYSVEQLHISCPAEVTAVEKSPDVEQIAPGNVEQMKSDVIRELKERLNVDDSYGYVTLVISRRKGKDSSDQTQVHLFGVNFGIPLFDSNVNEDVCSCIVTSPIHEKQRLDRLRQFNDKLKEDLSKFVSEYQEHHHRPSQLPIFSAQTANNPIPFPNKSIIYDNNRVQEWTGL